MASGINVERQGLQGGVGVCQTCIHELQTNAKSLQSAYSGAGSGWSDENYAKLGHIIEDCVSALLAPISDIEASMETLNHMISIVDDSESIF